MDFETFKDDILYWAFGFIGILIAYWAKSTRDDLKENDRKLSLDLSQHKIETNSRIVKVEESVHQSHLILTEIKGDIKLLNNGIQVYKKEKHDIANELNQYKGAVPELMKALMIAEKINDSHEKK